jgi:organic radical activating enzyme
LPIVIFGVQGIGISIARALETAGLTLTCFCDNSPQVVTQIDGAVCYTPKEAVERYPEAVFIASAMEPKTCRVMEEQIHELSDTAQCIYWDIVYFPYIVAKRDVDENEYAAAMWAVFYGDEAEVLTFWALPFRITSRCTLQCKYCVFCIPLNKNQIDYPFDHLFSSFNNFSGLIDGTLNVAIQGGEPLLHENLSVFINEIQQNSKALVISLITNGTLIPSDEVCALLAKYDIIVRISNYELPIQQIDKVQQKLKQFDVPFFSYHRADYWYNFGIKKHNRSDEENRVISKSCPFFGGSSYRQAGLAIDGLRLCDKIEGAVMAGYSIPDDYLFQLTETSTRKELREFIKADNFYKMCDYCNWPLEKIPAGEQLER